MKNPHVLVIDDNLLNIEVIEHLVVMLRGTVAALDDPTRLDALAGDMARVDAVFLDLEMPVLNGYDVLRILKDDWDVQAPIVAYTVHTSEVETARREGFDGFLGKPLVPDRFADQLRRILAGEAVWFIP